MTLGDRVKAEREARGLTQQGLADLVTGFRHEKTTQVAIHHIEKRGSVNPGFVVELARALKVNPEWLRTGRGPKTPKLGDASIDTHGEVAAGLWLDLNAAREDRNYRRFPIAADPNYPADAQYVLIVRGTSINLVADDGEALHCLDFRKAGVEPQDDDFVVVERRRAQDGEREVTAKRLKRKGRLLILSPESSDSRWKPIELDPRKAVEGEEIALIALVLAAYRPLRGRR